MKMYYQTSLKKNCNQTYSKNIYQRISKETFPAKRLEEESLPKISEHIFAKNLLEDDFSTKISLKRNLCQPIFQKESKTILKPNLFDDDMYLTKNSLKRNPYQTYFNKTCTQKKYWTKHVHHKLFEEKSVQSNFR